MLLLARVKIFKKKHKELAINTKYVIMILNNVSGFYSGVIYQQRIV